MHLQALAAALDSKASKDDVAAVRDQAAAATGRVSSALPRGPAGSALRPGSGRAAAAAASGTGAGAAGEAAAAAPVIVLGEDGSLPADVVADTLNRWGGELHGIRSHLAALQVGHPGVLCASGHTHLGAGPSLPHACGCQVPYIRLDAPKFRTVP